LAPWARGAVLRLRLGPSARLGWLLGAGHVGVVVLCWITALGWWLSIGLSTAAVVSLAVTLRYHALRSAAGALTALELRQDGSVAVQDQQGRWSEARVLGSSFVSPVLTILNLKVAGARLRRSVVVAPDSLPPDDFRRLRVWLRWRRAPTNAGTTP
jgi:hypothetical protein